jgi:hypothetical protein
VNVLCFTAAARGCFALEPLLFERKQLTLDRVNGTPERSQAD